MDLTIPTNAYRADRTVDWDALHPDVRFTESRQDLIDLNTLAQLGQINDTEMRSLSADQLVYLAAHDPAVASFEMEMDLQRGKLDTMNKGTSQYVVEVTKRHDMAAKKNKLEQNARRAGLEIERRREERAGKRATRNVLLAAAIGAVASLVGVVVGLVA